LSGHKGAVIEMEIPERTEGKKVCAGEGGGWKEGVKSILEKNMKIKVPGPPRVWGYPKARSTMRGVGVQTPPGGGVKGTATRRKKKNKGGSLESVKKN